MSVGRERHQVAAARADDDDQRDRVLRAVAGGELALLLADAELVDRPAERAGDRVAGQVLLDDGDVDAGGRRFRHASTVAAPLRAGHPPFGESTQKSTRAHSPRLADVSEPGGSGFGVFVADRASSWSGAATSSRTPSSTAAAASPLKYPRLDGERGAEARRFRPDVVYAHFLFPAGGAAAPRRARAGAGLVVTAHGRDVRNIGTIPGVGRGDAGLCARADAVIAVSDFLRRELRGAAARARGPRRGDRLRRRPRALPRP